MKSLQYLCLFLLFSHTSVAQFSNPFDFFELFRLSMQLKETNSDLAEAERIAAAIKEKGEKLDWWDAYVNANNHLVKVAILNAEYGKANDYSYESLQIIKTHEAQLSDLTKAGLHFARGMTLTDIGHNDDAIEKFEAAIDTFNRKNFSFYNLSHLGAQAPMVEQALKMLGGFETLEQEKQKIMGHTYNGLAFAHRNKANFEQSIEYFNTTLSYYRRADSKLDEANTYMNLAEAHFGKSWDKPEVSSIIFELLDKAIALYKTIPDSKFYLAAAYSAKGAMCNEFCENGNGNTDTEKALALFKEAKQPTERLAMPKAMNIAIAYLTLARGALQIDDKTQARQYLEEAEAAFQPIEQKQLVNLRAGYYLLRATLFYELDDLKATLAQLEEGLKIIRSEMGEANAIWPNTQELTALLSTKARVLEELYAVENQANYLEESHKTFQLATLYMNDLRNALSNRAYGNTLREKSLLALALQDESVYKGAMQVSLKMAKAKPTEAQKYQLEAFKYLEQSKAYTLRKRMLDIEILKDIDTDWVEKERMLRDSIQLQRAEFNATMDAQKQEALIINLRSLQKQLQAHMDALQRTNPTAFERLSDFPIAEPGQVQAILDDNSALLSYALFGQKLYTFVITKDKQDIDLVVEQDVDDALIGTIRTAYESYTKKGADEDLALRFFNSHAKLYQVLISPVKDLIKDYKRLVISTDRELNYINFDLLHPEQAVATFQDLIPDHTYEEKLDMMELNILLRNYAITHTPSVSIFYDVSTRNFVHKDLVYQLYGGIEPRFESWKAVDNLLPELAEVLEDETNQFNSAQAVSEQVFAPNTLTISGNAADETAFRKLVAEHYFSILHLSSHAVATNESSYILLSKTGTDAHDDLLALEEIYNMDVIADVGILDACQTGFSHTLLRGEGLMSLERAFFKAGCQSLLTSLWNIETHDDQTIVLDFCRNLKQQEQRDMDIALQQAKLKYLDSRSIIDDRKMPYYWAALRISGKRDINFPQ